MSVLPIALLVIAGCVAGAACGSNIENRPLRWQGVDALPRASGSVERALSAEPFALGLRDLRPDPTAVGTYRDTGFVVRTTDNVGQYGTDRLGEMLVHAGARLEPGAPVTLEADLLDDQVIEGNRFVGTVRMRTTVKRGADPVWSKAYTSSNERRGRTHNPENFNEALSNSLADAMQRLLRDDEFAKSLGG